MHNELVDVGLEFQHPICGFFIKGTPFENWPNGVRVHRFKRRVLAHNGVSNEVSFIFGRHISDNDSRLSRTRFADR